LLGHELVAQAPPAREYHALAPADRGAPPRLLQLRLPGPDRSALTDEYFNGIRPLAAVVDRVEVVGADPFGEADGRRLLEFLASLRKGRRARVEIALQRLASVGEARAALGKLRLARLVLELPAGGFEQDLANCAELARRTQYRRSVQQRNA
jgi:hypothetical protein